MKGEVICTAVVRVALDGRVKYRHEFEDYGAGKFRMLLESPTFIPGEKYTLTISTSEKKP